MSDVEADTFPRVAQTKLELARSQAYIRVDAVTRVVGFARGAPYREGVVTAGRVD